MEKISKKKPSVSGIARKKRILDDIASGQADEILAKLADEDTKISKRIQELALEHLVKVDPNGIAENVFYDLNALEVEDVWDNSGGTRDGYVDPDELASEMFEEALEPYMDELRKCLKLSMDEAAKFHCMGILKGIYKFEKEGSTKFQDYVADDPCGKFQQVFAEWKKGNRNPKNLDEMKNFVERNFPEWSKDALK